MTAEPRLPWEVVETLPSTDARLMASWEDRVTSAVGTGDDTVLARALVGRVLSSYWAVQEGLTDRSWDEVRAGREADLARAEELARGVGRPDAVATALLGRLYGLWDPDHVDERAALVQELTALHPEVTDEELRLRIGEWRVLDRFDAGDLDGAAVEIGRFSREAAGTELVLFRRREDLWRSNVAMLEGRLDEAVRVNQDAISSTADTAGSPFSFQNVAVVVAIERFFRRGLADVVDAVRSIRASSPRVGANWDTGLAFTLAETGRLDEAAELFEHLAAHDFAAVPRDLNWLVTLQLLALVALHLEDRPRAAQLLELLRPFGHHDATHGSGYASYGPVGRVLGRLAACCGRTDEADHWFEVVLGSRPPGPWTSLTRLDRVRARMEDPPVDAVAEAERAEAELRAFGMDAWAAEARGLADRLRASGMGGPTAALVDRRWRLTHPSGTAELGDGVGAGYLVRLLAHPGAPVAAIELDRGADPHVPRTAAPTTTLDDVARAAYRRRLQELGSRRRPLPPTEAAEVEMLRRELAGGSYVASGDPELERARVRVTKALRRAVAAVSASSPGLGAHLRECVSTGRDCCYTPPDGAAWTVRRPTTR